MSSLNHKLRSIFVALIAVGITIPTSQAHQLNFTDPLFLLTWHCLGRLNYQFFFDDFTPDRAITFPPPPKTLRTDFLHTVPLLLVLLNESSVFWRISDETEKSTIALKDFHRFPSIKQLFLCGGEFWSDRYKIATVSGREGKKMIEEFTKSQGR